MRTRRSAVFFFVLLSFGLMWAVPATDISETAYDESESQPYHSSSIVVIAVGGCATNPPAAPDAARYRSRRSQTEQSLSATKSPGRAALCNLRC